MTIPAEEQGSIYSFAACLHGAGCCCLISTLAWHALAEPAAWPLLPALPRAVTLPVSVPPGWTKPLEPSQQAWGRSWYQIWYQRQPGLDAVASLAENLPE